MPDPFYGEKACAYLIMHAGRRAPTVAELGEFLLRMGIAKYKLPERIETIDAFPLTKVGKADKAKMRAMIAEKIAQEANQNRLPEIRLANAPLRRMNAQAMRPIKVSSEARCAAPRGRRCRSTCIIILIPRSKTTKAIPGPCRWPWTNWINMVSPPPSHLSDP